MAANVIGILNDAREFSLFLSEHILANVVRVLTEPVPTGFGWAVEKAVEYVDLLLDIATASGGSLVESGETVVDCIDFEDNRVLECAAASGSVLIVSDDHHLISMSPWNRHRQLR